MKKSKDNKIFIDNDYAFEMYPGQLTLVKKRITKKGQLQYDTIGYYTSLEAAYNRLVDAEIEDCKNFQDIAERQSELRNYIKTSLLATLQAAGKHQIDLMIPSKGP